MDLKSLQNEVLDKGYAIYTDASLAALGNSARTEYLSNFHKLKIHSPREKFHYTSLDSQPWRKFAISSANAFRNVFCRGIFFKSSKVRVVWTFFGGFKECFSL